uniref:Digestive organ expansion factor putative n=1 Tax=Albugo laibachii Nc14 TaxID=890382 RepID=F0W1G0_9STRA|nr:digestive organ expansion factor putative [Albugo laibachii Nc14]|eukprot:CCA14889.1 digestive organ expansion factor putative [Albugo laibachii Nc14]
MAKSKRKGKRNGQKKRKRGNSWEEYGNDSEMGNTIANGDANSQPQRKITMKSQWQIKMTAARAKQRKINDWKSQQLTEKRNTLLQDKQKKLNALYGAPTTHNRRKPKKSESETMVEANGSTDSEPELGDNKIQKTLSVFDEFVQTFGGNESESEGDDTIVSYDSHEEVQEEPTVINDGDELDEDWTEEEADDEIDGDEEREEENIYHQRYHRISLTRAEALQFEKYKRKFRKVDLRSANGLTVWEKPGIPISYLAGQSEGRNLEELDRQVLTQEIKSKIPSTHKDWTLSVFPRLRNVWKEKFLGLTEQLNSDSVTGFLCSDLTMYKDILFAAQTHSNTATLRLLTAMHVLNHVFRSRDIVSRNNARLRTESGINEDCRDQGFSRPTVLILLPIRSAAVAFVEKILSILPPSVKHFINKDRFEDEYGTLNASDGDVNCDSKQPNDKSWKDIFTMGDADDCFHLGLSFSRKSMRFFSDYSRADIVLASPLGLRQYFGDSIVETAAAVDALRQRPEATENVVSPLSNDILSSIEICVVDSASVMLMQNLEHVRTILQVLNVKPKEAPTADFSRIREWNLAFLGSYFRQTIMYCHGMEPALHSLLGPRGCRNIAGTVKYQRRYHTASALGSKSSTTSQLDLLDKHNPTLAAMSSIVPRIYQLFQRIDLSSDSTVSEADVRFAYFEKHILQPLLSSPKKHVLIFIPSYFDFVRLRNFFAETMNQKVISCAHCCEYTSTKNISRARTSFFHGRVHVLLVTERFHFYHEYVIRGIHQIVWYGIPVIGSFYADFLNAMMESSSATTAVEDSGQDGEREDDSESDEEIAPVQLTSIALYSVLDRYRLQRIVGNGRADRMCQTEAVSEQVEDRKQTFVFS